MGICPSAFVWDLDTRILDLERSEAGFGIYSQKVDRAEVTVNSPPPPSGGEGSAAGVSSQSEQAQLPPQP